MNELRYGESEHLPAEGGHECMQDQNQEQSINEIGVQGERSDDRMPLREGQIGTT